MSRLRPETDLKPIYRNGYRMLWVRERQKYVYEHRLVMEQKVGRRLRPDEIVHHENEDKLDNRPENLTIIVGGMSAHARHHIEHGSGWGVPKGYQRPGQRKPLKPCPVCGTMFKPGVRTKGVEIKTCSWSCGQTYRFRRDA